MELLQLAPETLFYHCPYNPSHSMPHKTLMKHLVKCPDKPSNYRSCIYNISHVMPQSELQDHEENCPNRILFDTVVYEPEDLKRPVPVIDNVPSIEYDESWDGLEQTSDVLKDIKKKTVLMKAKHGETKSERKKYRVSLHEHDIQNNLKQTEKGSKCKQLVIDQKPFFIGKRPNI